MTSNQVTSSLFCTFYVDKLFLGVNVLQVQEVLLYQPLTKVPLSPSEISGIMNLRGQTVTAIDLRKRLGLRDRPDDSDPPFNIVLLTQDGPVSLLVDRIGDVIETSEETLEPAPETLEPALKNLIHGVYKLEDALLVSIDIERVSDTDTRIHRSPTKPILD